jgi:hypothetical protein
MAAAPESADSSPGGGLIGWIDQRFPLTKLWKDHVAEYYAPKNFNFWYYFGSLAMLILVNQLVTGIFLTMNYKPSSAEAFSSVEYIMRDVDWGWLIRYLHSTGASAFFIVIYLHMFRALLYGSHRKPRELVWIFGCLIFLLLMAEGFMGYVLPWGNMSYWGAQVIVSLFGSLPVIGQSLVEWIRGDYYIADATLNRFFALHVAALPLALIFLVIAHLMALHEVGSNNPDGIEIKTQGRPRPPPRRHSLSPLLHGQGPGRRRGIPAAVLRRDFLRAQLRRPVLGIAEFRGRQSAADPASYRAGVVLHAVLRHVARSAVVLRDAGLGRIGDGRLHRRAVLRALAGPLAGEIDPLPGSHLQGHAGHLRHIIRHIGDLRHEAPVGHLPPARQNLHVFVLCFFCAHALVHETRPREAGAGKGHRTCLNALY